MITVAFSKEQSDLLINVIQNEINSLIEKNKLNQWNMPPHLSKEERDSILERIENLQDLLKILF